MFMATRSFSCDDAEKTTPQAKERVLLNAFYAFILTEDEYFEFERNGTLDSQDYDQALKLLTKAKAYKDGVRKNLRDGGDYHTVRDDINTHGKCVLISQ